MPTISIAIRSMGGQPTHAILEFTPGDVALIRRRRDTYLAARRADETLCEWLYLDSQICTFREEPSDEETGNDGHWCGRLSAVDWTRVEEGEPLGDECDHDSGPYMNIGEYTVEWVANGHGGDRITTVSLWWEDFDKIAALVEGANATCKEA